MGGGRFCQTLQVVAALEDADDPASAVLLGEFHQFERSPGEVARLEAQFAERVAIMGVEAGRDEDEVGGECVDGWEHPLGEGGAIGGTVGAGRQRNVENVACAGFGGCAGAGVERPLVSGGVEDGRVVPKGGLGAVAVMDVPIDDGDTLRAVRALRVAGGDGDGGEEAETHRPVGLGVVAGRADRAEGVGDHARHHRVDGEAGGADRVEGGFEALGREEGVDLDRHQTLGRRRLGEPLDVALGMDEPDLPYRGARGGPADEAGEGGGGQRGLDGDEAGGPLGVAGGDQVFAEDWMVHEQRRQKESLARGGLPVHLGGKTWPRASESRGTRLSATSHEPMTTTFDMSLPGQREAGLASAVAALARGEVVGIPTETVYGLAADATLPLGVARIFEVKGRPRLNPLIVHFPSPGAAELVADFDPLARKLAAAFWPGPLTLVLPKRKDSGIAELATAGLDTVAIRVPGHPVSQALLQAYGRPLAAPSANRSGSVSPTTAAHVAEDLGASVGVILDGGPAWVGLESTIVSTIGGRLTRLRPGGLAGEEIERVAGLALEASEGGAVRAPGMLASHYAPAAALRLDADEVRPGEALLAFGTEMPSGADLAVSVRNLSRSGDLREAAATLFGALRELDGKAGTIAVMPIPDTGLGVAINDRLRRAAAPRR